MKPVSRTVVILALAAMPAYALAQQSPPAPAPAPAQPPAPAQGSPGSPGMMGGATPGQMMGGATPGQMSGQMSGHMRMHDSNQAMLFKGNSRNVEEHIAKLHSALRITPAEEPQWAAFAQVMRENAARMEAAFKQRGAGLGTMNAVQNLQSYAQIAQVQAETMQNLVTAFQTLYASFPPAQQALADTLFRPKFHKG